jgi:hypothetical protein
MTLEYLGGVYSTKLLLQGHCNKVGERPKAIRGPMARPQDFEPARNFLSGELVDGFDEAEGRTLPMRKTFAPSDS